MAKFKWNGIKYESTQVKICVCALILFFIISVCSYLFSNPWLKYTFYFEDSKTDKVCVEHRQLPIKKYPENVIQYVNELVIGPKKESYKFLFSYGTSIKSCFVRDDVLYINLSKDVLQRAGSCSEIKTGIKLFKKNVLNMFGKIISVEMYIDNKSVYTYENVNVKS